MADDLFGAAAPEASGEVPREVFPSIVWDEKTEASYLRSIREWAERFPAVALEPKARAQVEQTTRWHLELDLLNMTIEHEVARAKKLFDDVDKRKLHTEWLRSYGARITDTIVRRVKDPTLRSPNLGRGL